MPTRRLFAAGKLAPRRPPVPPLVCPAGQHVRPLLRAEVYDAMPGWEGLGECPVCGSTVHISRTRPEAA